MRGGGKMTQGFLNIIILCVQQWFRNKCNSSGAKGVVVLPTVNAFVPALASLLTTASRILCSRLLFTGCLFAFVFGQEEHWNMGMFFFFKIRQPWLVKKITITVSVCFVFWKCQMDKQRCTSIFHTDDTEATLVFCLLDSAADFTVSRSILIIPGALGFLPTAEREMGEHEGADTRLTYSCCERLHHWRVKVRGYWWAGTWRMTFRGRSLAHMGVDKEDPVR